MTRRLVEEFASAPRAAAARAPGLDELTPRELEVWRLVARGLSNAEIAAELVVGETTVKTHVARLLMKLSLRDRVQAVVLAYESGVVAPRRGRRLTATPQGPPRSVLLEEDDESFPRASHNRPARG